jgi:hypothetical protein
MTKQILKNEAIKEIVLSSRDPIYFIEKYCKIRSVEKGLTPFKLYDYQKEAIANFLAHDKNIVNKARQLGFSAVTAAFIVWLILFHKHKSVLIVSTKADVAKNMIRTVKAILSNVPDWMYLANFTINQAHMLGLSNGSWVKSVARSKDAGRSESISLLVIDEAAHIEDMDEIWKGLASTIATGGKVIALSTPRGAQDWFYRYCQEARSGESDWHYQEVFWWQRPDYAIGLREDATVPGGKTSPWFEKMTAGWSRQQIAQELLTSFTETGDTFLDPVTIKYYDEVARDPIEKMGNDNNLWIYRYPEPKNKFIVAADVASGTAEDFSSFVVLETETMEVYAEYKGKMPPDIFGEWLTKEVGPYFNDALIAPENNGYGLITIYKIKELGYKNLAYIDPDSGKILDKWTADYKGIQPGFSTNSKTRPIILAKMEEYLRKRLVGCKSKRLINELNSFVWHNGRPQAKKGHNDDLIMSLSIAIWIRDSYFQHHNASSANDLLVMYGAAKRSSTQMDNSGKVITNDYKERYKRAAESQMKSSINGQPVDFNWIYRK